MIIAHVYNPVLKSYIDNNHPDYKNQVIRTPCTYKLVAEYSEYVKNNDVIYYEVGFMAAVLKTPIENVLSTDQIKLIKDKKALLAIDLSLEVYESQISEVYENLIIRDNIPPEQILLLSHTLDYTDRIQKQALLNNKPLIKYEYFPYWIRLQQTAYKNDCAMFNLDSLNHKNSGLYCERTNKKFLFLNNNWKDHRVALLCLLNNYDLIKDSYTSFSGKPEREGLYQRLLRSKETIPNWLEKEQTNTVEQNWQTWTNYAVNNFPNLKDQIINGSDIGSKLPLILDVKQFPLHIAYIPQTPLLKFYKNTYFSVVTESGYQSNVETFITEKPFKAITYKHPFVYCSHPHSLKKLKQMGYKTFDGIINENYDKELDPSKRMLMIADEVNRLCNLNDQQLKQFKQECIPIVEYNFDRFMNEKSFIQKVL